MVVVNFVFSVVVAFGALSSTFATAAAADAADDDDDKRLDVPRLVVPYVALYLSLSCSSIRCCCFSTVGAMIFRNDLPLLSHSGDDKKDDDDDDDDNVSAACSPTRLLMSQVS